MTKARIYRFLGGGTLERCESEYIRPYAFFPFPTIHTRHQPGLLLDFHAIICDGLGDDMLHW